MLKKVLSHTWVESTELFEVLVVHVGWMIGSIFRKVLR